MFKLPCLSELITLTFKLFQGHCRPSFFFQTVPQYQQWFIMNMLLLMKITLLKRGASFVYLTIRKINKWNYFLHFAFRTIIMMDEINNKDFKYNAFIL